MIKFNKKEWERLIFTIFLLTLIFAFDDGNKFFVLTNWLLNYFEVLILVALSLLFSVFLHKLFANKFGAYTEFHFLNAFTKRKFTKKLFSKLPFGILLSLLFILFSNGKFPFTLIGENRIIEDPKRRILREWKNLRIFEIALIASSGPIANLILIILASLISFRYSSQLIFINTIFLIYNLLPIPKVDGGEMLFNSIPVYLFTLFSSIVILALVSLTNPIGAIIFGLIIGGMAVIGYFYLIS